ncbi:Protein phosphatase 1 regulatory subunit 3E [Kappamyces sp. JEL0829]|nr:Protein phosphatase 1 regulatory subunit 3E [Kappamyces sp. JEL0829]
MYQLISSCDYRMAATIDKRSAGTPELAFQLNSDATASDHCGHLHLLELSLGHSQDLAGMVKVANYAFEKDIVLIYSWDHWQSVGETSLEYHSSPCDQFDQFAFSLDLSHLGEPVSTLSFCFRYRFGAHSQIVYENNRGRNFSCQVYLVQRMKLKRKPSRDRLFLLDSQQLAGKDKPSRLRRSTSMLELDQLGPSPSVRSLQRLSGLSTSSTDTSSSSGSRSADLVEASRSAAQWMANQAALGVQRVRDTMSHHTFI